MKRSAFDRKIDKIIGSRKIIVSCGTGGVGKTTLSAAIALRAAMQGKRTAVITIDPAKRLATSLGIQVSKDLGDQPKDITEELNKVLRKLGYVDENITGSLSALMPDTQKTFETLLKELTPSEAIRERVVKNPIFQVFTQEFSGANEYMALERLYQLYQNGNYDCIILDTPPSRNTLAFLTAPKLLSRLFEEKLIRFLVLPTNKLLSAGMRKALGILERLTGAGFMTHLFDFMSSLFEVQLSFTANLNKIMALMASPEVGFVMVAAPSPDLAPEVSHFIETLRQHRFHFDGIILNRTFSYLGELPAASALQQEAFAIVKSLQKREKKVSDELKGDAAFICARLPELARDVHSVEDLFHVAMAFDRKSSLE